MKKEDVKLGMKVVPNRMDLCGRLVSSDVWKDRIGNYLIVSAIKVSGEVGLDIAGSGEFPEWFLANELTLYKEKFKASGVITFLAVTLGKLISSGQKLELEELQNSILDFLDDALLSRDINSCSTKELLLEIHKGLKDVRQENILKEINGEKTIFYQQHYQKALMIQSFFSLELEHFEKSLKI